MRLSKITRIKDPYNLWYEYLKRSKKYQDYCAAMRTGKTLDVTEENAQLMDIYYAWGDVFQNPFAKSYEKFKRNRTPVTREAVVDYKIEFRKRAMHIIKNYKKEAGKKITFPEFINRIERDFKRQTMVLKIDPTRGSDNEILAEVKDALKEKRSEHSTGTLKLLECVNSRLTTNKPDVEYLKKCLQVYDLREQGMTFSDIIKTLEPKRVGDFKHSYRRYYQTAKAIICNIERGLFPGDYPHAPDEQPTEIRVLI